MEDIAERCDVMKRMGPWTEPWGTQLRHGAGWIQMAPQVGDRTCLGKALKYAA